MRLADLKGVHPTAAAQPDLTGTVYANLKHGILNGRRDPIQANPEGLILDGANRYAIAVEHEIADWPVEIVEVDDEDAWILDQAMSRRSMSKMERVFLAAELTLDRTRADNERPAKQDGLLDNKLSSKPSLSTGQACELLDVNRESVRQAKVILRSDQRIQLKADIINRKPGVSLRAAADRLTDAQKKLERNRTDLTALETAIKEAADSLDDAHRQWKADRESLTEYGAVEDARDDLGELRKKHRREITAANKRVKSCVKELEDAVSRMPATKALNEAQELYDRAIEARNLKREDLRKERQDDNPSVR